MTFEHVNVEAWDSEETSFRISGRKKMLRIYSRRLRNSILTDLQVGRKFLF